MPESALYTPLDFSEPVKAGRRRFWKQILPVTEIDYEGRKVKFDEKFHKSLELAFEDKVYDQIPLVFADGNNTHNEDPRNFGGEIVHMENRGKDGTWALIEADKEAAKIINKNPKLGVSARIRQGIEKGGKVYDNAVRHVLMTMFPRVQNMSPWQAVDLSDDSDIEVVDLTAEHYKEGTGMATKTKRKATTSTGKIDLSALSDEQFENLLDLAQAAGVIEREDEDLDEDEDFDEDDVEAIEAERERRKVRRKKSKTKITVEKDSEDDDPDEDDEDEDEDDETDLSDADKVLRRNEVSQFTQMRLDLAERQWQSDRDAYVDAGVPPFIVDLAEPVLSLPDPVTIDLSDGGESVDATEIIRKMLDGFKGVVDLTGEAGHQIDLSTEADDETTALLKAWDEQYG